MRIVALSDTHMPRRAKELPQPVRAALADTDYIIHAGDITALEVLDTLAAYAPVAAVAGNIDPPELRDALSEKKLLRLCGFAIGICHGHGSKGSTLQRAIAAFEGAGANMVVFGHSHIPYLGRHDGTLLLNPGSPTDRRRSPFFSYGVIETGETLSARLVYFDREGTLYPGEWEHL